MLTKPSNSTSTRRSFLQGMLPLGAMLCSGCGLLASSCKLHAHPQDKPARHKFFEDSGLMMIEAVRFAYQYTFIPLMEKLADQIGREKLIEMVKEATGIFWSHRTKNYAQRLQKKDLDAFLSWDFDPPIEDADRRKRFWSHALTSHTIEATAKSYEMKVTECLWAQTFREADAADLGFAAICQADEAIAASFDPRLKLTRTKTLMNGDDCCHFRWVWEE